MKLESKHIVVEVLKANLVIEEALHVCLKKYSLTLQQFNVLRILRGQKGKAVNLKTVQCHMIHRMSNITRLVDKLILKDLVNRKLCEKNRREIELLITKKGVQLLNRLDPVIKNAEQKTLEKLTQTDKEVFYTFLQKITTPL